MTVTVLNSQNLQDLCLQMYGDIKYVFVIALDNNISITETLEIGRQLNVPVVESPRTEIVDFYAQRGIKPASGATITEADLIPLSNECNFCKYFQ